MRKGSFFLSLLATVSLYLCETLAEIGPVGDLIIANADVSPDGYTRMAALAGGTIVGELIVGQKGDDFAINVINNLDDSSIVQSTSIHWHGLFQRGTSWADGTDFVTGCPISHNNSFLYKFNAGEQAGTFWYHSHLADQYCEGLRGALIIYDPFDPHAGLYDIDDESTIITLSDWNHALTKTLREPTSDATLINGLGRWSGDPTTELAVIPVKQGTRYRFRLINMACGTYFTFSIEHHLMNIIEVDGTSHQPYLVDELQIFPGQRYSFVLDANQDIQSYWIHANPNIGEAGYNNGINSAILRYSGADDAEPEPSVSPSVLPLNETDLVPLENPGAPGIPERGGVDYALTLDMLYLDDVDRFTINGVSFHPPPIPVLLQILSGARAANELLPEGSVYTLPPNSTIELSIPGTSVGHGHAFHLHGHTFDVVRSAGSSTYNYENPVRRDVVHIGDIGANVTIRFKTDNAGPWLFHCHTNWHLNKGLAVVFVEDSKDWATTSRPPPEWEKLCPIYDALPASEL
ncbi:laccase lcc5 [Desarmillaria tabescens]|uniref:Laccase lcc5 n=1 Tax=Armillaria tabescens TaxID=1929756 RepID=A0AA39NBC3_ARMTA|nr:laccase lcc5 [Desarmillaria tabescens]KAK0462398.1 laccase lcc5 [Desarmillaria tabescens]